MSSLGPGDINDKLTWICFMIGWCSLSGLRATSKDIRIQTVQPTCTLSNHEYMKTIPKCPFQAVPTALLCLPSADKNRRHTSWILMLPIIPKLWILEDSDYKSQLVTAWVYRSQVLEGSGLWRGHCDSVSQSECFQLKYHLSKFSLSDITAVCSG